MDGRSISIQFQVEIPKQLAAPARRTKFLTDTENTIKNVKKRFLLVVSLESGESIVVEFEFCSLERHLGS